MTGIPFFFFLLNDNSTHTEYILVFPLIWSSLVVQMVRNLPAMQDAWIQSLGQEDLLEKEMASHSRILAWRIPHTEEPGGLQSMESQTVRHDWTTFTSLPLIQFTWSSLNSINFMYKLYTFYEGLISLIKVHSLFWLSLFFLCLNDRKPVEQYIALGDTKNSGSKNIGIWYDNKVL